MADLAKNTHASLSCRFGDERHYAQEQLSKKNRTNDSTHVRGSHTAEELPGKRQDGASKGCRMSDCTASKDPFCRLEREPWQTSVQQKSKSNTSGAPLGVLPVLGTLDLDSGEPQLRARGGLAGWQEKRVIEIGRASCRERV